MSNGENGNGNSKLVGWLLAGMWGLLTIGVQYMVFNRIENLDARARDNSQLIARLQEQVKAVDNLNDALRDITALQLKVNALEIKLTLIDDRFKTISERTMVINSRLDRLIPERAPPQLPPTTPRYEGPP